MNNVGRELVYFFRKCNISINSIFNQDANRVDQMMFNTGVNTEII